MACTTAVAVTCPFIRLTTNTTAAQVGPVFGKPKITQLELALTANSLWFVPNAIAAAVDHTWVISLTMGHNQHESGTVSTGSALCSKRPNHFLSKNILAEGMRPLGAAPF